MNRLYLERWYPAAGAILASAAWGALEFPFPEPDAARDLYATTMGFAAITVGFLATAMSIVVAAPDSPLVRDLAASGYLKDLVRYLREPFMVGLCLAGLCLLGFVVSKEVAGGPLFGCYWAGFAAWLVLSLYRVGAIFVRIIEHIGNRSLRTPRTPP